MNPEAGAHVVEDECGTDLVAVGPDVPGEGRVDELLVKPGVMPEGADDDRGDVVGVLADGGAD
jgi:hypothetical protein